MKRVLFGSTVLVLLAGSALADLTTNPGFETGDLTGWTTVSGNVTVRSSWTSVAPGTATMGPAQGQWFALLEAGPAIGNSSIVGGPFTATQSTMSFQYFWDNGQLSGSDVGLYDLKNVTTGVSLSTGSLANSADSGWVTKSLSGLTVGDKYSLTFVAVNTTFGGGNSYLGVDNVVVPVPGAVLLGFLGLSAAGLGLRKLA